MKATQLLSRHHAQLVSLTSAVSRFGTSHLQATASEMPTIALSLPSIGRSYRFLSCVHSYSIMSRRCKPWV